MDVHPAIVGLAVAWVAALYASVGHGGASGYLAIMALLSFPPAVMKPGALLLNLLVAGIGAVQYFRAGHFRPALFWPFALSSIPLSYIGARLTLSPEVYGAALGLTLLWAGVRLALSSRRTADAGPRPMPRLPATLAAGAAMGLLSGMVGVGGGIFLSPLFLFMRWADTKQTAAVSAAFIWVNSAAGMVGHLQSGVLWPAHLGVWVGAAVAGGALGSFFGARRWTGLTLRRLLAVVLLTASFKSFAGALK
jgi:uncharacterized protein